MKTWLCSIFGRSCQPDTRPDVHPNCTAEEEAAFESQCAGVLLSDNFRACHAVVPPEAFTGNCVYDMCEYDGMQATLCDNVEAYAQACSSAGVTISWRNRTFCRKTTFVNWEWNCDMTRKKVVIRWQINITKRNCKDFFVLFFGSVAVHPEQPLFGLHSPLPPHLFGPVPHLVPHATYQLCGGLPVRRRLCPQRRQVCAPGPMRLPGFRRRVPWCKSANAAIRWTTPQIRTGRKMLMQKK